MSSMTNWISRDTPAGWADIFSRSVKVAVTGFIVLQVKEWLDAGTFDTLGTGVDALLISGGYLVLNTVLMLANPK